MMTYSPTQRLRNVSKIIVYLFQFLEEFENFQCYLNGEILQSMNCRFLFSIFTFQFFRACVCFSNPFLCPVLYCTLKPVLSDKGKCITFCLGDPKLQHLAVFRGVKFFALYILVKCIIHHVFVEAEKQLFLQRTSIHIY
jgi:hypothetical protein